MALHAIPLSTTIGSALAAATPTLMAITDTPRLDAELLLASVLDCDRTALLTHGDRLLDDGAQRRFNDLITQRRLGTPVAHLLGRREFWSLALRVTPNTLIPRPETELLIELALDRIPPDAAQPLADLGTGAGNIALALAHERSRCTLTATDCSAAALTVARDNARRLVVSNVRFLHGHWFAPLRDERFALIVSNPPYLAADDPHLHTGDLRHEPRLALVAGPDGLAALRHLIRHAPEYLQAGGWLLLEHGYAQGEAVRELLRARGYDQITTHRDLAGHERASLGCVPHGG
jgi:release factor glutamine methyltransferase